MPRGFIASNARRWVGVWLGCTFALPAHAADFTVSSTANDGAGSLRQAIQNANASSDPENRILFSPAAPGTIQLTSPLTAIGQNLTIDGAAATPVELVVRGTGASTVLYELDAGRGLILANAPLASGDILLGSGSIISFDTTADQTVDSIIREGVNGAGALRKTGTGELRLTGENAYLGGTTIAAGTLVITDTPSGTSLPSAAAIEANGTLAFDADGDTFALTQDVAGAGAFEKRGSSTLRLEGSNSYAGGTRVLAGRVVGAPLNIPGNIDVSTGASVEVSGAVAEGQDFAGAITGAGAFQKTGSGLLRLTASNDIDRIDVLAGTLAGDAAALSALDISVAESAILRLEETGDETLAANISGAGQIVKDGIGAAKLSGTNQVAELLVRAGRLVGTRSASIPQRVTIDSGATLSFNPSSDEAYSGQLSGAGRVEKRGTATLELAGEHTLTGVTEVRAGRLDLTGTLAADVDVLAGGTLTGTGRVNGTINNEGTLAVSQQSTLSAADLRILDNANLSVTVAPTDDAALLLVDNSATLSSSSQVLLTLSPGEYASDGQTFTLLSAADLSGTPAFDASALFYDLTLSQQGNALLLEIVPNDASFVQFATNRNQASVANSLDIERPTATPDLQTVIDAIESLQSGAGQAYDQLAGEQITQLATVRLEFAERLDRSLLTRLRESNDSLFARVSPDAVLVPQALPTISSWVEPFAVFGDIDGSQGSRDSNYTLAGLAVGTDFSPAPSIRIGGAFSYGHADLKTRGLSGRAETSSFLAALYGGWRGDWFRIGLTSRVGYSDMQSERGIRISSLNRNAKAQFQGLDAGGRFEAGARLSPAAWFLVEPFFSASYTHLERSRVDERGADSVNLHLSRDAIDSATVGLGLRLRASFALDANLTFTPEIHSEWSQQLGDRERRIEGAFQDALEGSTLRTYGTELHRNAGVTGVAWVVRNAQGFEARFGYDIGYDTDRIAQTVAVSVTASW